MFGVIVRRRYKNMEKSRKDKRETEGMERRKEGIRKEDKQGGRNGRFEIARRRYRNKEKSRKDKRKREKQRKDVKVN